MKNMCLLQQRTGKLVYPGYPFQKDLQLSENFFRISDSVLKNP